MKTRMITRRLPVSAPQLAAVLAALAFLVGCTQKQSSSAQGRERATARSVNLAIWSNYISPALIQEFEKKTGIRIHISNYSSNEELLAKLQAGASGYDVAVPSDYMVGAMIHLGLLQELDHAKLGNFKHLDPKYLGRAYDSANRFSVPYDWGTTGIAVNRSLFQGKLSGWKDLFESPALKGKFTLLDDVRETLGAALKSRGYSLNSKNPDELNQAKQILLAQKARIKGYTSEPMMSLINGETAVAHAFMSDALQARRETGGKIEYILPEEGSTLWVDNLVIPNGARNLPEAHELINFLLEPASNASTVTAILVSPANKDVFALLPKEVQSNPSLFPSAAALSRCEMIQDLGESLAQWDRIWTEVKAAN